MGIGAAALYTGGFALLVRWVEPERYTRVTAAMVAIANLGSLLATTPFAAGTQVIGWRGAFLVIAGIASLIAAVMLFVVRDSPTGDRQKLGPAETILDSFKGLLAIIRDRRIQRVCALALVTYPTIASVFVLWGGPYLHDIHGLDAIGRGNTLLFMALAISAGPIVFSWIDVRLGARRTVLWGCALHASALLGLALIEGPSLLVVEILFTVLGLSGGYNLLLPAVSRFYFADSMAGRVMTTVTSFIIGGVAVFQAATGFIVGAFLDASGVPTESAYRLMFGFLALAMVVGTWVFSGIGDFSIRRRAP
jgi:predicted MFS family arabinose efflux permease